MPARLNGLKFNMIIEYEKKNRIIQKLPKLVCHKTNFVSEMIFEDEKEIFLFVSSSLQTIFGCDS